MDKKALKQEVDDIIRVSDDDELAHNREDILHLEVIREFCPEWVVKEVDRLDEADFHRWCA